MSKTFFRVVRVPTPPPFNSSMGQMELSSSPVSLQIIALPCFIFVFSFSAFSTYFPIVSSFAQGKAKKTRELRTGEGFFRASGV